MAVSSTASEIAAFAQLQKQVAASPKISGIGSKNHGPIKGARFITDPRLLFVNVLLHGGSQAVTENKLWASIGRNQNPPRTLTDLSFQTKRYYLEVLLPLEQAYAAEEIDLRTIIPEAGLQNLPPPSSLRPAALWTKTTTLATTAVTARAAAAAGGGGGATGGRSSAEDHSPRDIPLSKRRNVASPSFPTYLPAAMQAEELVGRRLGMYWPDEQTFFFGSATSFDAMTMKHVVKYDDGDEEMLELNKEIWVLIENYINGTASNLSSPVVSAVPHSISNISGSGAVPVEPKLIGGPYVMTFARKDSSFIPIGGSGGTSGSGTAVPPPPPPPPRQKRLVAQGGAYSAWHTRSGPPGFEIYVDLQGITNTIRETSVSAFKRGAVRVIAAKVFEAVVELPRRINPSSAQALMTPTGMLYIRVGLENKQNQQRNQLGVGGLQKMID